MAMTVTGDFATPFGTVVPSTYWRWVWVGIDTTVPKATVTIRGYLSEAAYQAGAQAVGERTYSVTGDAFWAVAASVEGGGGLTAAIEEYVRSVDEFFAPPPDAPPG